MIPRVLSIRQPWCWAMCSESIPPEFRKNLENRNWSTKYRGPILLHAALKQQRQKEITAFLEMATGLEVPKDPPLGGIVGKAKIVDVISKSKSPWFSGDFAFVLEDMQETPFIPCKGQLGIYYPDAALIAELKKKGIIK
jgi:hypothetical protein